MSDRVSSNGGRVLLTYTEKDVFLTGRYADGSRTWSFVLKGRIDYAVLLYLNGQLFTLLFEVTEHKGAPETVRYRLLAYAVALYGELGFPVVPVLLILGDHGGVDDLLAMKSRTLIPGAELRGAMGRLARALSTGEEAKPARGELCAVCDPSTRRICPYAH